MADGEGLVWNPPTWIDYKERHFPPPGIRWEEIVRSTGGRKGRARYHPRMMPAMIERFEMECLSPQLREQGLVHEILPHPKPNVRMFWREIADLGFSVGASGGRETNFMYVEYNSSGPVHGRPMTCEELRRRGAEI